jgi:hypothetical protein
MMQLFLSILLIIVALEINSRNKPLHINYRYNINRHTQSKVAIQNIPDSKLTTVRRKYQRKSSDMRVIVASDSPTSENTNNFLNNCDDVFNPLSSSSVDLGKIPELPFKQPSLELNLSLPITKIQSDLITKSSGTESSKHTYFSAVDGPPYSPMKIDKSVNMLSRNINLSPKELLQPIVIPITPQRTPTRSFFGSPTLMHGIDKSMNMLSRNLIVSSKETVITINDNVVSSEEKHDEEEAVLKCTESNVLIRDVNSAATSSAVINSERLSFSLSKEELSPQPVCLTIDTSLPANDIIVDEIDYTSHGNLTEEKGDDTPSPHVDEVTNPWRGLRERITGHVGYNRLNEEKEDYEELHNNKFVSEIESKEAGTENGEANGYMHFILMSISIVLIIRALLSLIAATEVLMVTPAVAFVFYSFGTRFVDILLAITICLWIEQISVRVNDEEYNETCNTNFPSIWTKFTLHLQNYESILLPSDNYGTTTHRKKTSEFASAVENNPFMSHGSETIPESNDIENNRPHSNQNFKLQVDATSNAESDSSPEILCIGPDDSGLSDMKITGDSSTSTCDSLKGMLSYNIIKTETYTIPSPTLN